MRGGSQGARDIIAIVGMACRFPGSSDYRQYWQLLVREEHAIREIPPSRWDPRVYYSPDFNEPDKSISKWCGLVDDIDAFDHRFFSISEREAKSVDPQQRLLLEETWHCIEDAGVPLRQLRARTTSVHVGFMASDYHQESAALNRPIDSYAALGSYSSILANRISYTLGLRGASLALDAACASSLVALHEARRSLQRGESDFAIVAGVSLNFHPWKYISFSKSRMLSPDGLCKTFDKDANGYVPGDGVGVLILRPLAEAIAAGDHIHGILSGSAVNHTGASRSITAPRVAAQRDVIVDAYEDAGWSPETVTYVEAHGTGTSLGDPIELEALTEAFRRYTQKRQYCGIGSVKSNIGHLEAAAGVAGVIKVLMMLKHRTIPRTLHVQTLNPLIHFEETPFVVATRSSEWRPAGDLPLRAGVSSFGFGGANAHVLLSAYERSPARLDPRARAELGAPHDVASPCAAADGSAAHGPRGRADEREGTVFIVSARSAPCLTRTLQRWETFVDEHLAGESRALSLRDVGATMAAGRESFAYRHGFYARDAQELRRLIKEPPSRLEKSTPPRWMTRFGALALGRGRPVATLLGARHLIERHVDALRSFLEEPELGPAAELYESGDAPERHEPLHAFLFGHAYMSALADLNLRPWATTGEGHGAWLALAQSGILPLSAIVAGLRGGEEWRRLPPRRPTLPFFDPIRSTYLMPYRLDAEYLSSLVEGLPVPATAVEGVLARARPLWGAQFTFKKFLDEWSPVLQPLGTTPERLLQEELPASDARRSLAAIVVQSSVRRLNRRWQLTDTLSSGDPRVNELVDLVVDGLMPHEAVVRLVLAPRPDLDAIAEILRQRQGMLDLDQPYSVLRKHSERLDEQEIGDFPRWIRGIVDREPASLPPGDDVAFLDLGQLARPAGPGLAIPVLDQPLELTALRLWLEGTDIRWEELFPEGNFAKVPLPGYAFDRGRFWLPEGEGAPSPVRAPGQLDGRSEQAGAAPPLPARQEGADAAPLQEGADAAPLQEGADAASTTPERRPPLTPDESASQARRAFTSKDRLIAAHVISDRPIVPGALMVEMALEASQRLHAHPTTTLKDVLFQRAVPVDAPAELTLEIEPESRRFSAKHAGHGICRGAYGHEPPPALEALDREAHACDRRADPDLYSGLARVGYRYGASLQVIAAVGQVGQRHVFELRSAAAGPARLAGFDPALFDGLLQAALVVGQRLGAFRGGGALYVPQAIALLEQLAPLNAGCLVCIDERDVSVEDYGLLADLRVHDLSGAGLLRVEGIFFRRVPRGFLGSAPENPSERPVAAPRRRDEGSSPGIAAACYRPVWERQRPAGRGGAALGHHAMAILRSEAQSVAWLEPLRARYAHLTIARLGGSPAQAGDGRLVLRDDQEEDFSALLRRVEREAAGEGVDIYFLAALTPAAAPAPSPPAPLDPALGPEDEAAARGAFLLAKALVKSGAQHHLIIGTRHCQAVLPDDRGEGFRQEVLCGIARTLAQENPQLRVHLVDLDAADPRACAGHLVEERGVLDQVDRVAYRDGVRYVRAFAPIEEPGAAPAPSPFQDGRVYLLLGGAGGLGLRLAEHIASRARARLVLVGRSPLGEEAQRRLAALSRDGCEVLHLRADISDPQRCEEVVATTRQRFGAIHGVLQLAGVVEDRLIVGKSWDSVRREMAPKAQCAWSFHQLTQGEPLDLFVTFSSVVSLVGNRGQVGYAAANSFLDGFIHHRARSGAPGRSFGVNWTLWEAGGMGTHPEIARRFSARGLPPIGERAALDALDRLMTQCPSPQGIVLARSAEHLFPSARPASNTVSPAPERGGQGRTPVNEQGPGNASMAYRSQSSGSREELHAAAREDRPQAARIEGDLRRLVATKIQAVSSAIDAEEPFFSLGVDSVALQEITEHLEHTYGSLTPTLLFEHPNIRKLARYLAERAPSAPAAPGEADQAPAEVPSGEAEPTPPAAHAVVPSPAPEAPGDAPFRAAGAERAATREERDAPGTPAAPTSRRPRPSSVIAIVGMSARFPRSPDVDAFWENLRGGRDCIEEIPAERWDHRRYFEETPQPDRTYGKWGGFIEDVACFDPMFFNISPREAEQMDPQQRLFLECAWATMEHAGYGDPRAYKDDAVGLFVGVMWNEYSRIGSRLTHQTGRYAGPGSLYWAIANRVSYWMNFTGPSLAIDTACSSSLIAVHQACASIQNGECDMAVAGGINLSIDPDKYLYLAQSRFLSLDGRCRSFGEGGTGYVPSEGVGAVLLKPLDRALGDGDHVYGVIRGSAINHGGRAAGFTVPDPESQARLVLDALRRARVSPDQLGYIECHGTGTALGDPIEIAGLTRAFREAGATRRSFPIGSVKSNLGHLEAAAGIAALIKVLLCMRHQAIPRSLHSETKNPNIHFDAVPFEPVNELRPWQADGGGSRFAGISSFGAGGSNAHVIVEAHEPHVRRGAGEDAAGEEALFLLSARNRERLNAATARLRDFLREQATESPSLGDIAYTLQVGRQSMDHRLALIASSREELLAKLDAVLAGRGEVPGVLHGQVQGHKTASFSMDGDAEDREYLEKLVRNRKLPKLAGLWLQGLSIPWELLHEGPSRKRTALPTYPFARERYWLPSVESVSSAPAPSPTTPAFEAPAAPVGAPAPRGETGVLENFFFHPQWSLAHLDPAMAVGGAAVQSALVIFTPEGAPLAEALATSHPGARIARVLLGAQREPSAYSLSDARDGSAVRAARPSLGASGAVEVQADDPGALERALRDLAAAGLSHLDAVYFLGGLSAQEPAAGDLDALERSQQRGLLSLFRLVKALDALGLAPSSCHLKIVTNDVCAVRAGDPERPLAAGMYGLARSIAKEYPRLKVSCIDVGTEELGRPEEALASAVIAEPGHLRGKEVALRGGKRFQRSMAALPLPLPAAEPYRQGGVYLVLGGASGLGSLFSQHLAEAHGARFVWLGRRPLGDGVKQQISEVEARGGEVLYLQADAGDPTSLRAAVARAKAHFGALHGVIHSAVVLGDHPIATTDEATFTAGVRAKIAGSVAVHQAVAGEPLDFFLYFGSIASYLNNGGASPYAAGCTFQDRYALFHRARAPYPVRLINWGYWGKVGAVARTADVQGQQFGAIGVGPIAPADGMEAVRRVLSQRVPQVVAVQLTREPTDLLGHELSHTTTVYPERFEPLLARSLPRIQPELDAVRALLRYQPSFDRLERFSEDLLLCAFQDMGALRSGGREPAAALRERLGIADRYSRLYDSLLAILEGAGYLRIQGDDLLISDRVAREERGIQRQMQQLAALPEIEPYVRLLWACYQRYPELLRAQVAATDVLFPQGSMDLMGRLYKGNPTADHFNALVIGSLLSFVEARVARLRHGEKIAILEVGAGTGGTSASVLDALDPYASHIEYFYTDISRAFTQYGKRQYGPRHPFVTFQPLNLEEDIAAQGYSPERFDVVLGANVVHATRNLRNTLRSIKSLLRAGGWLILNEMTRVVHFLTLTAGLLDGWWLFEDGIERMKWSPLLSASMWKGLLEEEGFGRVAPLEHSDGASSWTIQGVIVAESDGVVRGPRAERASSRPDASAAAPPPAAIAPAPSLPAAEQASTSRPMSLQAIESKIIDGLARTLQIDRPDLDSDVPFTTFGVDSIFAVELAGIIGRELGIELRTTALFNYPTTRALAEHIATTFAPVQATASPPPGAAAQPSQPQPLQQQAQAQAQAQPPPAQPPQPPSPVQGTAPASRPASPRLALEQVRQVTLDALAEVLAVDARELDLSATPEECGLDAQQAVAVSSRVNQVLGTGVTATELLRRVPLSELVDQLAASLPTPREADETRAPLVAAPLVAAPLAPTPPPATSARPVRSMDIAVVGISARLPDAETVADFWRNLCDGHDAIREIPPDRWPLDGFYDPDPAAPARSYSKWGGFLSDIGGFDPLFFGISPLEAELTDPQQRLFLQEAWRALEDAGYSADALNGQRCSVFVGCKDGDYVYKLGASADPSYRLIGNTLSILSARISYFLNLKGPSVPIDTACSSSLVALHLACQSLISGSSDLAVAGGVALMTTPISHVMLSKTGMLSPTGSCRTFDDAADGLVPAEGAAAVILKPLDAALRDRNHIYGVIRGSEANQDGRSNGITAPSTPSQAALEIEVYRKVGVHPETIGYVETHGTGTKLGDPIEIHALTDAFAAFTDKKRFCPVGSVKTNIGHTLAASGMASLIKVLCCLKHRTLVPSLHFDRPNRHIDFDNSPFYVNTATRDWIPAGDHPRRAAISSFGMSGTNVHVIVEEAPAEAEITAPTVAPYTLVPLSAKAPGPLHRKVVDMIAWLDAGGSDHELGDIGYTLGVGRTHFPLRLAFVARDTRDLRQELAAWLARHPAAADAPAPAGQPDPTSEQLASRLVKELRDAPPARAEAYREKLQALADVYATRHDLEWAALYAGQARRLLSLPAYPFNNRRFWVDEPRQSGTEHEALPAAGPAPTPRPERAPAERSRPEASQPDRADPRATSILYFQPTWEPAAAGPATGQLRGPVLLFDTDEGARDRLRDRCGPILLVKPGAEFRELGDGTYEINPDEETSYHRLVAASGQQGMPPRHVVYLWPRTQAPEEGGPTVPFFRATSLCRALAAHLPARGEGTDILYTYGRRGDRLDSTHAAMSGLGASLRLDVPHLRLKVLGLDPQRMDSAALSDLLVAEMTAPHEGAVRYEGRERQIQRSRPWRPREETKAPLRSKGVYLITGGAGGLGRVFAEHLARRFQARLALCGRSPLTSATEELLRRLTQLGAEVAYIRADIADREDVFALLGRVEARFGAVHGVIHSAGVTADANLRSKGREQMAAVLAPKLLGALHLDDATRHRELDFFALFSSVTAVLGNMGQTDYGYANSFMDHFAAWREAERKSGRRTGKTVSINWPLWREGGMGVSQEMQALLTSAFGMTALDSEAGVDAFTRAVTSEHPQVLVLAGDEARIHHSLGLAGSLAPAGGPRPAAPRARVAAVEAHAEAPSSAAAARTALAERVKALLLEAVSKVLKLTPEELNYETPLMEYGLESINVIVLANHLNRTYGLAITPVRFFEHETLASLGAWLCEAYEDHLVRRLGVASAPAVEPPASAAETSGPERREPAASSARDARRFDPAVPSATAEPGGSSRDEPVAIIGISGALPGSSALSAFWEHLDAGRCLVSELPGDRWDWRAHDNGEPNRKGLRWGSFYEDMDKFDPMFFGLSPREAELMDPQHRVFLQTVWKAIEDAGYSPSALSQSNTGVFVGAAAADYLDLLNGHRTEAYALTGTTHSILANRISFLLNLHGPSEPINTACSSALIAIHRAVEAIHTGSCDLAIAGGVNAILSPTTALSIAKAGMLSPDGKCKTFDQSANGYVRGEGAGALLLKPLRRALADGDHVYAVIKGSAENHGGRANSLTAPNPRAQADLIVAAFRKAGVDPTTVGYIETHGTGTALGDPIEINGLKMAFERLYEAHGRPAPEAPHCAIGSVKTNIGHLEAAAGIPSVFKVLLAMKHRKLPASLHLRDLNPYIELEGSPFRIVTRTEDWRPALTLEGRALPLRAGISSFGVGGSNAHLVLESFDEERAEGSPTAEGRRDPHLIVLSARDEERLSDAIDALIAYLRGTAPEMRPSLERISYTLLTGRDVMSARLACVATDAEELITLLSRHRAGEAVDGLFTGQGDEPHAATPVLAEGEEGRQFLEALVSNRKLSRLARLWAAGLTRLDWSALFGGARVTRASLPTYPFARERYWVPEGDGKPRSGQNGVHPPPASAESAPHPMIDEELSSPDGRVYRKDLDAGVFYLKDHVVAGDIILPGVGHLELARAAGELAGGRPVRVIRDVMWIKPILLGGPRHEVRVVITPGKQGVEYQIRHEREGHAALYSRGRLAHEPPTNGHGDAHRYDLEAIRSRCRERRDHETFYRGYREAGFHYGPSFRVNQEVRGNERESLGALVLPDHLRQEFSRFGLHPSLLDASLQAITGIRLDGGRDAPSLSIPFALGQLEILGPLPPVCYAYATLGSRRGEGAREILKFNVAILDETGRALVRITDFSARAFKQEQGRAPSAQPAQPLTYYHAAWTQRAL
ncbi:SDR family NAD(P)-dependent oxidoreductase [Sorangium sp. So ce590]|uniref:SDR family NAD(P)-dependent oxidoreductase n=1 Tax=Sorangium sp. So ce590 TaxID=3133317 RepID=UPI003F6480D5